MTTNVSPLSLKLLSIFVGEHGEFSNAGFARMFCGDENGQPSRSDTLAAIEELQDKGYVEAYGDWPTGDMSKIDDDYRATERGKAVIQFFANGQHSSAVLLDGIEGEIAR